MNNKNRAEAPVVLENNSKTFFYEKTSIYFDRSRIACSCTRI